MIITRRAEIKDLEEMLEVEKAAISNHYLERVYDDFFSDEAGEMIVAEEDGVIYGFGKITIQPDGDAWLELLRVHSAYQNKGAGKAIWKRYMEVAALRKPRYIRMYTGTKNAVSRHIAELNGVDRAYEYSECSLSAPYENSDKGDFYRADFDFVMKNLSRIRKEWGNYVCFNRTFYSLDEDFIRVLCDEDKVFTDGQNIVSVGARFMPERGTNIGFIAGNAEKCIKFAVYEAKEKQAPKITLMHRDVMKGLRETMESAGFEYLPSNLLMLEGDFA